jgi:hypothetical protein
MAIKLKHVYIVNGTGLFPFDMLRTDRSSPAREVDSAMIEHTTHPRDRRPHAVTLQGELEPNAARWRSFGWEIIGHTTRRESA